MPRQTEALLEPEKEFLREKCKDPVVRAVLLAGGFNCLNAANLVWEEYLRRFPAPIPAEDALAVQAGLEGRLERIRKWFKRNWREELGDEADTPPALPIPPLKVHKPKRISAYDIFRKSDLKKELVEVPYTATGKVDVGKLTTRIKTAFDGLNETQLAHFQTLADIANAARHAQQLQDHGSETELERARMIPSIQSWVQQVLEHLQKNVDWIGAMVMGGPDEDGDLKVRSACTGVDSQGRDFLVALCERIGWTPEQFNAFVAFWMYDAHRRRQTPGVTLANMHFDGRDVADEYLRAHGSEAGQTHAQEVECTSAAPRINREDEERGAHERHGEHEAEAHGGGEYDFLDDSEFEVVNDDDVTFDWSFLSAYTDFPGPAVDSAQQQSASLEHPLTPDGAQPLSTSSALITSPTESGPDAQSVGLYGATYPTQSYDAQPVNTFSPLIVSPTESGSDAQFVGLYGATSSAHSDDAQPLSTSSALITSPTESGPDAQSVGLYGATYPTQSDDAQPVNTFSPLIVSPTESGSDAQFVRLYGVTSSAHSDDAQPVSASSPLIVSPTESGPDAQSAGFYGATYPDQYSHLLNTTFYQLGELDLASSSEALTSYGEQSESASPSEASSSSGWHEGTSDVMASSAAKIVLQDVGTYAPYDAPLAAETQHPAPLTQVPSMPEWSFAASVPDVFDDALSCPSGPRISHDSSLYGALNPPDLFPGGAVDAAPATHPHAMSARMPPRGPHPATALHHGHSEHDRQDPIRTRASGSSALAGALTFLPAPTVPVHHPTHSVSRTATMAAAQEEAEPSHAEPPTTTVGQEAHIIMNPPARVDGASSRLLASSVITHASAATHSCPGPANDPHNGQSTPRYRQGETLGGGRGEGSVVTPPRNWDLPPALRYESSINTPSPPAARPKPQTPVSPFDMLRARMSQRLPVTPRTQRVYHPTEDAMGRSPLPPPIFHPGTPQSPAKVAQASPRPPKVVHPGFKRPKHAIRGRGSGPESHGTTEVTGRRQRVRTLRAQGLDEVRTIAERHADEDAQRAPSSSSHPSRPAAKRSRLM
ncbi:hypothetical protein C8Q76DRAFT_797996 [Earliella scabrosa]|nr:hypothetical protein C8Q76DRAFT_797996 [Earliella scabrosa]